MTKIFIIIASLITSMLSAQTNYNSQMEEAILDSNYESSTKKFIEISKAYPDKWLPNYYLAYRTINNSLLHLKDETVLKQNLNKAQDYLDHAYKPNHNTGELLVLQAKLYLVYIISNPEKYGRSYLPIITKLNNDAFALAPENPRVLLNKAQWEIGSATYFGSSIVTFCKDLESAISKFETYKADEYYAPEWGLEEAKKALNDCK
jgi:hypothetical protein